jgi:periplasmic protein TonB
MLFFNLLPQFKSTIKTIFTAQRDNVYAVIFVFLVHTALIAAIVLGQNQTPSKNILVQSPVMILNLTAPTTPEKSAQPSVAKTRPIALPKVVTSPKPIVPPKAVTPQKPVNVPKPTHIPPATVVQAVAIPDIKKSSDILPVAIQQAEVAPNLPTTNNAVVTPPSPPSNISSNSINNSINNSSNKEISPNVETSVKTPVIFNADYLNNPTPVYPNISRLRGETGKVLLRVSVNRNGQADNVELHRSSGSNKLDEAAIRTVRLWNFIPAKVDGNPVDSTVIVPIDFKLD